MKCLVYVLTTVLWKYIAYMFNKVPPNTGQPSGYDTQSVQSWDSASTNMVSSKCEFGQHSIAGEVVCTVYIIRLYLIVSDVHNQSSLSLCVRV